MTLNLHEDISLKIFGYCKTLYLMLWYFICLWIFGLNTILSIGILPCSKRYKEENCKGPSEGHSRSLAWKFMLKHYVTTLPRITRKRKVGNLLIENRSRSATGSLVNWSLFRTIQLLRIVWVNGAFSYVAKQIRCWLKHKMITLLN